MVDSILIPGFAAFPFIDPETYLRKRATLKSRSHSDLREPPPSMNSQANGDAQAAERCDSGPWDGVGQRGFGVLAVGLVGAGTALLVWNPHFNLAWLILANGAGFAAQRWVSSKPLMIVAVVMFALAGADPLIWSAIGLALSAWWERDLRERR